MNSRACCGTRVRRAPGALARGAASRGHCPVTVRPGTAARPQAPTWLTVTSANTVLALAAVAADTEWGGALERARASTPKLSVAAVGRATASALREAGVGVDFTPTREQSAAGMLAEWPVASAAEGEIALVPASELASATLADGLAERGYEVSTAVAYRMVPAPAPSPLHADVPLADDPPVLEADVAREHCARGEFRAVVAT
ncbi:uroporphyrinogen-III synthase, partial [Kocuria atrinae]|uniref:uroporphyrinogen-III synthase n=1 Tax=Kocuria atrinae TaxID=592377 RepID=UPI001CB9C689